MKWETVTSTIGQSVFFLWNNGKKMVTLVFNPSSSAARIESADERRVFLIRKEGFLKNKTIVRNEYGVRIGCAGSEHNEQFIELNNERFFYKVDNNEAPAVTIYKESVNQPLAVCALDTFETNVLTGKQERMEDKKQYSLLMALCWYLLPVKETQLDYSL